jgi:hypothetical protein
MDRKLRGAAGARLGLTVAFVVGVLLVSGTTAAACSVGEWDRRAETAVFVLGRVTSVELRPHVSPPPKSSSQLFQKIVTMEVDLVLKGRAASTVTFIDSGYAYKETLAGGGERIYSWGGGGDCGAIEEDPRGKYAAFALGRAEDGTLWSSVLHGSAFGTDARDPAITRLIESHGLSLPATSTEPAPLEGPAVGVAALALVALPPAVWLWVRRRRSA